MTLWSLESKLTQASKGLVGSCGLATGSEIIALFARDLHTNAYPTSNQQPKPEVGSG